MKCFNFTICMICLCLFFNSCKSDRDDDNKALEGRYKFLKVTSDTPVDYNADGTFETDLTSYFKCRPALTFQKNGAMTYSSININIENYTVTFDGEVLAYETPACEAPEYKAKYSVSSDKIITDTEWGDKLTYQIKDDIIISNFNNAQLVIDGGNGKKIFKRVNLEFQYSKN